MIKYMSYLCDMLCNNEEERKKEMVRSGEGWEEDEAISGNNPNVQQYENKPEYTKGQNSIFHPWVAIHTEWWKYFSWKKPGIFFNEMYKKENSMEPNKIGQKISEYITFVRVRIALWNDYFSVKMNTHMWMYTKNDVKYSL